MYRILPPKLFLIDFAKLSMRYILSPSFSLNERISVQWAKKLGNVSCVPFGSGRAALTAALKYGVRAPLKRVAVPSFICASVVAAIHSSNMKPLFIDIRPDLTMDPVDLEKKINSDVRAVIMPHIYGKVCDYNMICSITSANNCFLIDDAAACAGLSVNNYKIGTMGDFGIASMNFKTISSIKGGILIIPDIKTSSKFQSRLNISTEFRQTLSVSIKDVIHYLGSGLLANSNIYTLIKKSKLKKDLCMEPVDEKILCQKMNKMSALFGLVQLKYLFLLQERRALNSKTLINQLYNIDGLEVMNAKIKDFHTRFVIRISKEKSMKNNSSSNNTQKLKMFLLSKGIQCFNAYTPAHLLLNLSEKLPVTESAFRDLLIIPNNATYSPKVMVYIAEQIKLFFKD